MQFIVSMHAYDALDRVVWTARMREYPDYADGPSEVVLDMAGTFAGEGETDPRSWLRQTMAGIIEYL